MKFKFFTARPKANSHPATQPASSPIPQTPIILWKDSKYKKSLKVLKKYFSTLVFMGIPKTDFYNKVEELGLTGRIFYGPNDSFDDSPEALVTMLITKAKNLANAYIITGDGAYRERFIRLYNAFAEILDPNNKIRDNCTDLKSALDLLEMFFREPASHLL